MLRKRSYIQSNLNSYIGLENRKNRAQQNIQDVVHECTDERHILRFSIFSHLLKKEAPDPVDLDRKLSRTSGRDSVKKILFVMAETGEAAFRILPNRVHRVHAI